MSQVLTAITDLYEVCEALEQVKNGSLIVVACDSGSDKSFDFLGAAKAIQGIKDIFLGIWDRIAFHKELKTEHRLDLIAKSLPIFDQLAKLEQAGSMKPEQAEIFRRQITNGATQLIQAGAIISEIEQVATAYDPRKLMAPETKLLDAPTETRKSRRKSGRPKRRIIIDED